MNRNQPPLLFPIVSLSTIVSLAVSFFQAIRHGVLAGLLLFGECLLLAFVWVFLLGMLSAAFERLKHPSASRIVGVLALVKNVGLVFGPIALLLFL